jgi:hypothetical protein
MGRNIETSSVAVTSTVTKIVDPTGGTYPSNRRTRLLVLNTGTNTAFVGETNAVTTGNGYPVYPVNLTNGVVQELELKHYSGSLYAICANTETATIKVLEQYE